MELPTSRRLLVGAATLLALLTTCRATSVTECPRKEGYDSEPDRAYFPAESSDVTIFSSLAAAEAACNSDPSCGCFNSNGEVLTACNSQGSSRGSCLYTKTDCPSKIGFDAYGKVRISVSSGGSSFNAGSATAAEAACSAPGSNCAAWTTEGLVITSGLNILWDPSLYCLYVTNACSYKFGFEVARDYTFEGLSDVSGTNKGTMGSALEAEAFCKITPKCSAWNSKGEYLIGGIKSLTTQRGTCVFRKQPCPPVAGFTAYYGFTVDRGAHGAPAATESALCFADIKTKCTADANCKLFDTLRNIWHADSEPLTPFPGMCTYRKIDGV